MIPVEGHPGLCRDPKSGAIINIGNEGEQHSANRARMAADKVRMESDQGRLDQVERDVSDIKMMLKQLIER